MSIRMKVTGLGIDPQNQAPIIVLSDSREQNELIIAIGLVEASAIAIALEQVNLRRPSTHDLLCNVISSLDAKLERVDVTDLKDGIYHACLVLKKEGEELRIDARTSDAIATALRLKCPIFVSKKVLRKSRELDEARGTNDTIEEMLEEAHWAEFLENLPREEFGKYIM